MRNQIGETIKRLRLSWDLTQLQLAELIGVTDKAISKWECGDGMPDFSQLVPLAKAFDVSMDTLFGTAEAKENADEHADEDLLDFLLEAGKRPLCIFTDGYKLAFTAGEYENTLLRIYEDGQEVPESPVTRNFAGSIGIGIFKDPQYKYTARLYGYKEPDRSDAVELASINW